MSQEKGVYHLFCEVSEFLENKMLCKRILDKRISVAKVGEGEYLAFEDSCPHQGESLSKGRLVDCTVTCPAHNWKFDLRTGESTVVPDEFIYVFPVKLEGARVYVRL